ncbi:hypothetical protein WDW37_10960 [Bdellovibrionota bacterium FG-1]
MKKLITLICICLSQSGCAHGTAKSPHEATCRSLPIITADSTPDPLSTLEQELSKIHSDRVTVSTSLLRNLVRNQKIQQNQCKNISGQLEAIKNVDMGK